MPKQLTDRLTPARRKWLEEVRDDPQNQRGRRLVGHQVMKLGWTRWKTGPGQTSEELTKEGRAVLAAAEKTERKQRPVKSALAARRKTWDGHADDFERLLRAVPSAEATPLSATDIWYRVEHPRMPLHQTQRVLKDLASEPNAVLERVGREQGPQSYRMRP